MQGAGQLLASQTVCTTVAKATDQENANALAWGDTLYVAHDNASNGLSVAMSANGSRLVVKELQNNSSNTIYSVAEHTIKKIYLGGQAGQQTRWRRGSR